MTIALFALVYSGVVIGLAMWLDRWLKPQSNPAPVAYLQMHRKFHEERTSEQV